MMKIRKVERDFLKEAPGRPKAKRRKGSWLRMGALVALAALAGVLIWSQGWTGLLQKLGTQELLRLAPEDTGQEVLDLVGPKQATPTPKDGSSPFSDQRTQREAAYQEDRAALSALIENADLATETREDAAKQLARMVADHQAELAIEEALQAAGFVPSMTLLQNGALTVMVEAQALSATQSATILSLCAAHVDLAVENIRIMTSQPEK